jgi:hypothetical protein
MIMSRHRKEDAFFYLVRIKHIANTAILEVHYKYKANPHGDERVKIDIEFHSYLLATSYAKALELFIEREFYPTFAFFESKLAMLQDARERKDIIKDVNIALSKLERLRPDPHAARQRDLIKAELSGAYEDYMKAIGEDPDIKLTEGEARGL